MAQRRSAGAPLVTSLPPSICEEQPNSSEAAADPELGAASGAAASLAPAAPAPKRRTGSPGALGRTIVAKLLHADYSEDVHDSIDYGASSFNERRRSLLGPLPLRVRVREALCGSGAFFSLFGWRFMRRSLRGIWRPQFLYTSFAVALVLFMEAIPEDLRVDFESSIRSFALLFDFTRVFLVFTLTAVVGTMYNRWWEQRRSLGVIIGRTLDTTIMVCTYIHGEASADLKCDLVRYLNLAHVLIHMQARGKSGGKPLFELEELLQVDLLTEEEYATLRSHKEAPMPQVAYMWFLQLWLEAVREGLVPNVVAATMHRAMQENVTLMRGAAGDIGMYQSTPPPVGYFRVLYMLLNVSLLISPFGVYATLLDKKASGHNRWMVVPVVFVVTFFLLSFIHMCYEMFDPFAEGLSHFPLKSYLASTMSQSYALLETPREGRLCYYSCMASPGPTQDVGEKRRNSHKVAQAEQQLNLSIKRNSASIGSMNLFGTNHHDPSEQAALWDLQEGHRMLGRKHASELNMPWLPHGTPSRELSGRRSDGGSSGSASCVARDRSLTSSV